MAKSDISFSTPGPINIPLERSLYVGTMIRGILYGVEIFIFLAAVYCIGHRPSKYRKSQIFYIVHGGILLALVTIEVAVDAMWGQFMWIDHRNYPGGPLHFLADSQFSWSFVLPFAASVAANIFSDGILVYRCYIIWGPRWYILTLPVLTYLASSVLAIMTVVESALPSSSVPNPKIARVAVPWVSLSVGLNIIVTSMICLRLLQMRALAREALSPEMSTMYTSVVAMLIESAAPNSIVGIGLIIVAAQNGPLISSFAFVWNVFCSLSPQIIILRVAMGRGWLKQTADEISTTLVFAKPATIHEQTRSVRRTIYNTEEPISGSDSETLTKKLDTSIKKQTGTTNVMSFA